MYGSNKDVHAILGDGMWGKFYGDKQRHTQETLVMFSLFYIASLRITLAMWTIRWLESISTFMCYSLNMLFGLDDSLLIYHFDFWLDWKRAIPWQCHFATKHLMTKVSPMIGSPRRPRDDIFNNELVGTHHNDSALGLLSINMYVD